MTPPIGTRYPSGTMTLLYDAVEAKKFDVRVIDRNVERGLVRSEDREKALKSLEDDAANADYVSIQSLAESDSVK